jgi:hypothetical protein
VKILSDAILTEMQEHATFLRQQNEDLRAEITRLTNEIIELKRDGFARPQPHMAQQQTAPDVDPRILAAIRQMAPEGSRLESELVAFAQAQLLAENEIEDVADMILAGSTLGDD